MEAEKNKAEAEKAFHQGKLDEANAQDSGKPEVGNRGASLRASHWQHGLKISEENHRWNRAQVVFGTVLWNAFQRYSTSFPVVSRNASEQLSG